MSDLHSHPAALQQDALPAGLRDQLDGCGPADLVVGIPSFGHADAAARVADAVKAGLAAFFPGIPAAVVLSEGGSTDGAAVALRAALPNPRRLVLARRQVPPGEAAAPPYHGMPGKAGALRTVLAVAEELGAKACVVLDPDNATVGPAWLDLLLSPILRDGIDLVAPVYLRHKYDGLLNRGIVYPLTRSMYGRRVREPMGGEFGCSARLVRHWLAQSVWESELAPFGIDAWLTVAAISGGFQVGQAFLGTRIHAARDPAPALPGILHQVVGSLFELMDTHVEAWMAVRGSAPVPLFGQMQGAAAEPVRVDTASMVRAFRRGVRDLEGIWRLVLRRDDIGALRQIGIWDPSRFYLPDDLWIQVLHDFALAFHRRVMDRQHLLQALTPLYLGWVASFAFATRQATAGAVEAMEERTCLRFEDLKPDLAARWDAEELPPAAPAQPRRFP